MATSLLKYPTILDYRDKLDPKGAEAQIVRMLDQSHDLMKLLPMFPTNDVDSEQVNVKASLPTAVVKAYGEPVAVSKGENDIQKFPTALMETVQECPVDIANLGGNPQQYMLDDTADYLEALMQKEDSQMATGDHVANKNEMMGLNKYFNTLTGNLATNMISLGGSTNCTRIYLLGLGRNGIYGAFPKGSQAGIKVGELSKRWKDTTTGVMEVYTRNYQHQWGLVVANWANSVCLPNLDVAALRAGTSTVDLIRECRKALWRISSQNIQLVWAMNLTAQEYIDDQAYTSVKAGGGITHQNIGDRVFKHFLGIPVMTLNLSNSETAIS